MDNTIYRPTTPTDKAYFDIDLNKPRRQKDFREQFTETLMQKEKEATLKHLPFARHAAREDFDSAVKAQIQQQVDEYGEVMYPEQIKVPNIDWEQYSNLKNFTLVDEGEKFDTDLSKKNPGLSVNVKWKRYYYKNQKFRKFRVMEEPAEAIRRAQEANWKARSQFDKK